MSQYQYQYRKNCQVSLNILLVSYGSKTGIGSFTFSPRYLYDIVAMNWKRLLQTFIQVHHALRHFSRIHYTTKAPLNTFSLNILTVHVPAKFNSTQLHRGIFWRRLLLISWGKGGGGGSIRGSIADFVAGMSRHYWLISISQNSNSLWGLGIFRVLPLCFGAE